MLRAFLLTLALVAPLPAYSAVIGTFQRDYGSGAGEYDPGTNDTLRPDYVLIDDNPTGDTAGAFADTFSLTSLAGAVIDTITLTITYSRVNTNAEGWFFDIYGSNPNSFVDNSFTTLDAPNNSGLFTESITISAATDVSPTDAFATSIANEEVRFGFDEVTNGTDRFRLYAAVLTVNGTAAVPIPAPGLLLLAALGWLTLRRRQASARAAA